MLKDKNDSDADARELVRLIKRVRPAGQGQSDPVQPVARRALRMLDARADPQLLEHRLRSRHFGAGAHPARPRHRRRLRAAQDRGGEEEPRRARPRGRATVSVSRLLPNPPEAVRRRLAREVHALFHSSADEPRVTRSPDALIAADSVAWRVHGDVTTMMAGGIAALLLQMLHPAALAGVWDHSDFEDDMLGRLRRTARFIAVTTYAERGAGRGDDRAREAHPRPGRRHAARRPRLFGQRPGDAGLRPCRGRVVLPRRLHPLRRAANEPRRPGPIFRRGRGHRASRLAPIPSRPPAPRPRPCSTRFAPTSAPTRAPAAFAT